LVLSARLPIALLCLLAVPLVPAPAAAHKNHNELRAAEQTRQNRNEASAAGAASPAATAHMTDGSAQPPSFGGRLASFAGRMHPFAVHFPIALFPIAWIALIFARRRGEPVHLIRAFIVVAGAAAAIAAALGWLNAGFQLADRDPIQLVHRWLGTALAVIGGALALWAWRCADAANGRIMIWGLGGLTMVLLVQGWLGAAVTHGLEHMMF
jgi:uncharacterized membrane protein